MIVKRSVSKIVFVAIAVLAVGIGLYPITYFVVDRTFGLLSSKSEALLHDLAWNIGFYTHILFGGVALLVGWTQFHAGWRATKMLWHRRVGMLYVVSVLLSGLGGLYIALHATGGLIAVIGFFMLAVLWLSSTSMAFLHVRALRITKHQQWMIISYALCFSAVTLRFWLPLLGKFMVFVEAYRIVAWLCWVPNIIVAYLLARGIESSTSDRK